MDVWSVIKGIESPALNCAIFWVFSVADAVRHDRLKWFGHLEHKSADGGCQCQLAEITS